MTEKQELSKKSIYHIRVGESLDKKWADWFDGFVMASRDNSETLLTSDIVDQSSLNGVLGQISSLGLQLLMAARIECPCPKKNCTRRGQCHDCATYHAKNEQLSYCLREKTRWDKQCMKIYKAD